MCIRDRGGPPCASYKLRRAVRPPTSKMVRRADRPLHHLSYAGRSALLPVKWCAGRTAWINLNMFYSCVNSFAGHPVYLAPLCTDWICLVKLPSSVNCFPHWSQAYLTPSCWDWIWVVRLPHWLQVYLNPSCFDLMCFLRPPSSVYYIAFHTDHKDIWHLHV